MHKNNITLKILVALAYVAMVAVNYLANALPIGGITTGEASDSYPNLFTPAGITFSIWGLIYLLLLGYTLYQFGLFQKQRSGERERIFDRVGKLFFATSLANIGWIFAWHYGVVWLSVLIMVVLLSLLIRIAEVLKEGESSLADKFLIRLPFSVYLGWITVATIANVTVFLVSFNWDGFGLAEDFWAVVILVAGAMIGITRMIEFKDIAYGLVLVWAYGGIWFKHASESGFGGRYPNIISTVVICIALFLSTLIFISYKQLSRKKGQE